jgi:lipopolysaccharide transport system permease protein
MQVIETGIISKDYWKNLWNRRELIYYLTRRDLIIRYKQTFIGIGWVAIRPFLTMLVFTIIFGSIAQLDSNGLPYGFVVFAGILPWFLFSNLFGETSGCLLANTTILTKIYFPRLVFPITILFVGLVDFCVAFLILIGMMIWYQITPSWTIIFIPCFVVITAAFALGIGLMAATLNVRFRDFQQLIPFLLQMGIYLSPVGYLNQLVPRRWEIIYALNPLAGIINGFRWCLVPESIPLYWPGLIYSIGISFFMLYFGIKIFRKAEDGFADTI